jgi:carboxyl-terminal processing protease
LGPGEAPSGELEDLFNPFWEAWDIVHEYFVNQPVDDLELMRGAIRGMLEALDDPHSSYMDPDQFRQSNIPLEGEYEGIGAWVDPTGEFLIIIAPMPGSPAEAAGLQPGDQVIAIDGEDMTGIDGNLVIRRILGPAGTTVRLTILREGEFEPFDVDIQRASITIPSLESRMLDDDIAYIQLFNFGEKATDDLRDTLRNLLDQDPVGLIFDLRGNGGGFLGTAIDIASEFIAEGAVVIERFGDGSEQIHSATGAGIATDIPLIVLIDGGSASASEIVAGAIQDHDRGLLVGETSFGKGSVQTWTPLSGDNGAVRVTIALWYTPDGRLIHQTGLEPDVEVLLTEDDILNNRDPQLDEAVRLLLEGLD